MIERVRSREAPEAEGRGDSGYMLLGAIVLVFLLLLALSVAAPRIAMDIKRDRELESQHRAQQYVRGIRVYYQKFKHYPSSVEQLEKTNNQKFLREKYLDPLTGKDDWRLIHQGENKTTVKGFFGEDLPGLPGGLGGAAGLQSSGQGQTTGNGLTGAFANSGIGSPGGAQSTLGSGGTAGSSTGSTSGTGSGIGPGINSGSSSGSGTSTAGSGISSQNATDATGGGGPIMGVGSSKSGDAMLVVNEQGTYQDWEFLYDPRIEQLYAKGTLLGGVNSGIGGSSGFGTPPSTNPTSPTSPTAPTTPIATVPVTPP